jgi:glycerol kinase
MDQGALYLALDQGGSASRALVFDARGRQLAAARIDVGDRRPQPGWVEQDPDAVANSLRHAAEAALEFLDEDERTRIRACGLCTQRSSLVAWDRHSGAALSPVLSWQDTRAAAWLEEQSLDADVIRLVTGLHPNAHYGLGKMRWLLDKDSKVRKAAADGRLLIGPVAAFLAFRLLHSRPARVDPANASRTLLLGLDRCDWNNAMLSRFGIERAWLPEVVRSDADYGDLVLESRHLPLRLLSGDQSTAAFAHGELRAEAAYVNAGTGAFVFRATDADPPSRLLRSVVNWSDRVEFVAEGTVNGAGSALAAFAKEERVPDVGAALDAAWQDCGSAGDVVYLNGIGGLGSPDWRSEFPSRFIGEGTPQQRLVAVAESIAFLIERNLSLLRQVGAPCTQVVATGGISLSNRFCQSLADLVDLPVHRPAHCEATARGAAFLLAGRPADWAAMPRKNFTPHESPALHSRHHRWQAAMAAALA